MIPISNLIPGQPILSWILVLVGATLILYFVRTPAHQLLQSIGNLGYRSLRLSSRTLSAAALRVSTRNREVLFEHGRELAERELERNFIRLGEMVEKDLARYPNIQRNIEQNIAQMEDKLSETGLVPPPVPEWTEAVEAIAKLKDSTKNDAVVGKLLQAIYEAFHKQQAEVLSVYRQDIGKRHGLLKDAMAFWRRLNHQVMEVGKGWQNLIDKAKGIDRNLEHFENLLNGSPKAERILKASTTTQFFVSLLVVVIAGFGAFVNFNLIALPMSELMPASSQVAGMDVAQIGAAVIILLEIVVGLFFMEAIGITRLFPIITFMEDKKRIIWAWVCISFLLALCCVEAGLAFMREQMVEEKALLTSFLVGGETAANEAATTAAKDGANLIPMIGQMTLGFVLPLILMFVAIPLESLIHTGRNVLGDMSVYFLRFMSALLRVLAVTLRNVGTALEKAYDILCFGPLWIEHLVESRPVPENHVTDKPVKKKGRTTKASDHSDDKLKSEE